MMSATEIIRREGLSTGGIGGQEPIQARVRTGGWQKGGSKKEEGIMPMPVATTQGKVAALTALRMRRKENETRERVNNVSLPAGSSMHYDCIGCGADIVVPERWITKPDLCPECRALKDLGWLE